ncbi:MAG: alpha-N-acetylglucosaminidase TIM-barrel domain-containing protein, partial [Rudaea sp.]
MTRHARLVVAYLFAALLGVFASTADCKDGSYFDLRPAREVVQRVLADRSSQIDLDAIAPRDGHERFRISNANGRIKVEGSSTSALLFGVNWYLKYVAQLQVSTNGNRLGSARTLPLPDATIEHGALYPYRYALNQNTDGYTMPYWDWPRWQREIDLYALSGINTMIVERGMDSVLYETFREFGYSDAEIRAWITQPAHQNWQLMGNLCCFNGPISRALM